MGQRPVICDSDLQAAALAVDPDAIFFLSDVSPDVPNNYAYASIRFEQLGIPEMLVETVHEGAAEGQIKTRLQGFFEKLGV